MKDTANYKNGYIAAIMQCRRASCLTGIKNIKQWTDGYDNANADIENSRVEFNRIYQEWREFQAARYAA